MKTVLSLLLAFVLLAPVRCHARHYRQHHDFRSLSKVTELIKPGVDTSYVRKILGAPVDMGFEYRYLTDSVSADNCPVGAAFSIDNGIVTNIFIVAFCE
jgi:hypothetical protein